MTKVSVVIVNFNTKKLTLGCIASIKKYTKLSYEIIVVDNGSTDDSVVEISNLKSRSKAGYSISNLSLIQNKENLGFAKAVNQGIRKSKGEYVLLLNSDTQIKLKSVDKLVNFASRTPDAGVVGPKLLNPDGRLQASVYNFPSIANAIAEFWFGKKGAYEKYAPNGNLPKEVDSLVMAAFLITPQAIRKVGLLNEKYFMFFEDLDYCRRVYQSGLKVYYFPNAEVVHYLGASGKSLASGDAQWKRLVPSSKIYNGVLKHYILTLVLWSGKKWQKFLGKNR